MKNKEIKIITCSVTIFLLLILNICPVIYAQSFYSNVKTSEDENDVYEKYTQLYTDLTKMGYLKSYIKEFAIINDNNSQINLTYINNFISSNALGNFFYVLGGIFLMISGLVLSIGENFPLLQLLGISAMASLLLFFSVTCFFIGDLINQHS